MIERVVNVIVLVLNGYIVEDWFEGLNLQLGDWYVGVKIFSVSLLNGRVSIVFNLIVMFFLYVRVLELNFFGYVLII